MIGTRGVPARYGGFETAVEEIGARLAARGHDVVVYCRNPGQKIREYRGMRLVNLPALRLKQAETLSHTALSLGHAAIRAPDVGLVFNAANAPLLWMLQLRHVPVALHVDGLEWRRSKWSGMAKRYYLLAERIGVRRADRLIADARAIQSYYRDRYRKESTFIAYGAPILSDQGDELLGTWGLRSREYHLVVARMEPENNVLLAVSAHAQSSSEKQLLVIGGAPHAARYTAAVHAAADGRRTIFAGNVWDEALLNQAYSNACLYIHGHSVGGTNPSLLRAMGAGAAVAALDVSFNREVLGEAGVYYSTIDDLTGVIEEAENDPAGVEARGEAAQTRAAAEYRWDEVADRYEALCAELAASRFTGRSSSVP